MGEFSQRCFLLLFLIPPSWVMVEELLEFVAGETQGRVTHSGQGWGLEDRDSRVEVTPGLAHEGQPKITELPWVVAPRMMKNRESCWNWCWGRGSEELVVWLWLLQQLLGAGKCHRISVFVEIRWSSGIASDGSAWARIPWGGIPA